MKKILATFALVLAVLVMVSCSKGQDIVLEKIEASGYKTEFVVGDAFEKGSLVVNAVYTDESVKDVTADATVTAPATFENVGTYAVKVSYEGEVYYYEVKVSAIPVAPNATYDTVEAAVEAAVANADKVASGSAIINQYQEREVNYEFGENHVYMNYVTDEEEHVYEDLGDDVYFGFSYAWGYYNVFDSAELSENSVKGVKVTEIIMEHEFYGAEGVVAGLYALANESGQDLEESISACAICGDQTFNFSFGYYLEDYNWFYMVYVSFEVDKDGVLSNVEVKADRYNSTYEVYDRDWESEDEIYTMTEEDNFYVEEGVVTLVFGAEVAFTTTVSFNQVAGAQDAVNEYAYKDVMFTSFDLQDEEGNDVPAAIEVEAGQPISLVIANYQPTTAVAELNKVDFVSEQYGFYGYFDGVNGSVTFYSAGVYEISVVAGNVVKELTVTVTAPAVESISTYVSEYVESWWGAGYEMTESSTVTIEAGAKLYVGAMANPEEACQDITVALKEEYSGVELSYPDFDAPGFDGVMMQLLTEAAGTYVVVFTSDEDSSISEELTVVVTESTKEPVALVGTWKATFSNPRTGMTYNFTLVLNEDLTATFNYNDVENAELTYVEANGAIEFTVTNGWAGELNDCTVDLLNNKLSLVASTEDYGYYPLDFAQEVEGGDEEEVTLDGAWTALNPMGMAAATLYFIDGGFVQVVIGMTRVMCSYTVDGSDLVITVPAGYAADLQVEDVVLAADYSSISATITFLGDVMPLNFTKGE